MDIQSALLAASDPYAPSVSVPSLQQYDNYQIYDLHCVDIESSSFTNGIPNGIALVEKESFLAVQVFHPDYAEIPCIFSQLVLEYP